MITLYLYKIGTNKPVLTIEDVVSYTADRAETKDGAVYSPFADDIELSSLTDCSETLRADWRKANPPMTERVTALEEENIATKEQLQQADDTAIELYEANLDQKKIDAAQDDALIELYEMLGG